MKTRNFLGVGGPSDSKTERRKGERERDKAVLQALYIKRR